MNGTTKPQAATLRKRRLTSLGKTGDVTRNDSMTFMISAAAMPSAAASIMSTELRQRCSTTRRRGTNTVTKKMMAALTSRTAPMRKCVRGWIVLMSPQRRNVTPVTQIPYVSHPSAVE